MLQKISMALSVFWRLKEAEDLVARNPDEGLHIFAFQVALNGSRKFKVMTFQQFWDIYELLEPKFYYEVVLPEVNCKLFLDLEYEGSQNPEKNGLNMVAKLIDLLITKLLDDFGHQTSVSDVLVLQSYHKTKFSTHLVFHQTVFKNISEVGGFIKNFTALLTLEDREYFTVNHDGRAQLFIDLSVYRRNQQFRCYMSRKMGRSNPLIVSPLSASSHRVFNRDSVFASLLTNIDHSLEFIQSDFSRNVMVGGQSREETFTAETPFKEVDDCIAAIISPGRISSWTYHAASETYCYSVEGNSFCQNVKRTHSISKIYFLFCVKNRCLWQQCFSQHCKGFRSEAIDIPDLTWLEEFEEPWAND